MARRSDQTFWPKRARWRRGESSSFIISNYKLCYYIAWIFRRWIANVVQRWERSFEPTCGIDEIQNKWWIFRKARLVCVTSGKNTPLIQVLRPNASHPLEGVPECRRHRCNFGISLSHILACPLQWRIAIYSDADWLADSHSFGVDDWNHWIGSIMFYFFTYDIKIVSVCLGGNFISDDFFFWHFIVLFSYHKHKTFEYNNMENVKYYSWNFSKFINREKLWVHFQIERILYIIFHE